jgi:hypothetical protein
MWKRLGRGRGKCKEGRKCTEGGRASDREGGENIKESGGAQIERWEKI